LDLPAVYCQFEALRVGEEQLAGYGNMGAGRLSAEHLGEDAVRQVGKRLLVEEELDERHWHGISPALPELHFHQDPVL